jgi:hypothetical protein
VRPQFLKEPDDRDYLLNCIHQARRRDWNVMTNPQPRLPPIFLAADASVHWLKDRQDRLVFLIFSMQAK